MDSKKIKEPSSRVYSAELNEKGLMPPYLYFCHCLNLALVKVTFVIYSQLINSVFKHSNAPIISSDEKSGA